MRARRGEAPEPVLSRLEQVTTVRSGPGDSLLLTLAKKGRGKKVQLASLGFPDEGKHIIIRRGDLELSADEFCTSAFYCQAGERLVFPAGRRLIFTPTEPLLARRKTKAV
jgi:hypothetical protein